MKLHWQVVLRGTSVGVSLNWYRNFIGFFRFGSQVLSCYLTLFFKSIDPYAQWLSKPAEECSRSQTPLGMPERRIMVDTLRDCYIDLDKGYYLWNHLHAGRLFWFGRYRKISVWAISDVLSESILECHWIQAIIATSLNVFVVIINGKKQVVDWVVRTCSSSARIWTIVQYPLLQSSMFRAHHRNGDVIEWNDYLLFRHSLLCRHSEKGLCTASMRYCTLDPLKTKLPQ